MDSYDFKIKLTQLMKNPGLKNTLEVMKFVNNNLDNVLSRLLIMKSNENFKEVLILKCKQFTDESIKFINKEKISYKKLKYYFEIYTVCNNILFKIDNSIEKP